MYIQRGFLCVRVLHPAGSSIVAAPTIDRTREAGLFCLNLLPGCEVLQDF